MYILLSSKYLPHRQDYRKIGMQGFKWKKNMLYATLKTIKPPQPWL